MEIFRLNKFTYFCNSKVIIPNDKTKFYNMKIMNRIASFLAIAVFSVLSASAQQEYKVNVGQFDKIQLSDNINVVYSCVPDSSGYAAYTSERNMADAYIFTNKKGTLKISVSEEYTDKDNLPTVRVYSDFITGVENSSKSLLHVDLGFSTPTFSIKLVGNGKIVVNNVRSNELSATIATGNGTIAVNGKCDKASFKMVGTGVIQADGLEATSVKCTNMGTGTIGCWATKTLDVRGIGSTKVYYKGNPEIKKVGGGKVFPLTEASAEGESSEE